MPCGRRALILLLLGPAGLFAGCKESSYVALDVPYARQALPAGQARVYVYWPPAAVPQHGVYRVTVEGPFPMQLLPGSYQAHGVAPGPVNVTTERTWDLDLHQGIPATIMESGIELPLEAERDRVYYLRASLRWGWMGQRLELRRVPDAIGEREIRECRLLRLDFPT